MKINIYINIYIYMIKFKYLFKLTHSNRYFDEDSVISIYAKTGIDIYI